MDHLLSRENDAATHSVGKSDGQTDWSIELHYFLMSALGLQLRYFQVGHYYLLVMSPPILFSKGIGSGTYGRWTYTAQPSL